LSAASHDGYRFELAGARIVGRLLLRDKTWAVPVKLSQCRVEDGIDADYATCSALELESCWVGKGTYQRAFSGTFLTATGIDLSKTKAEGGCDLEGATIKGCLDMSDMVIADSSSDDWAIDLTNTTISGDCHLDGIMCPGSISVAGANISGQLCLVGARIGNRSAAGATSTDPLSTYSALWGQGCTVKESVLAQPRSNDRTEFFGYVSFSSANVGSLNFLGAALSPAAGAPIVNISGDEGFARDNTKVALDLYSTQIGGTLKLKGIKNVHGGQVDLRYCSTKRLTFLADGEAPDLHAMAEGSYAVVGLTYQELDGDGAQQRRWLGSANDAHKPGPYLTLAGVAQNDGRSADALKAKILASSKAANPLEKLLLGWVRYGYRPYFVVFPLALLFVTTLGLALSARDDPHAFAPATINNVAYAPATKAPVGAVPCDDTKVACLNPPLYALDAVLPVGQGQVSTWRVTPHGATTTALSLVVVIDQYASWALAGVFLAAIAGFLKRT
jgi:hypothetical protein